MNSQEKQLRTELWELVRKGNYLSYECHDEIVWRAMQAIKNKSTENLCGHMVLFKPDDACDHTHSLEKHSAEDVAGYMERLGIMRYVLQKIEEQQ